MKLIELEVEVELMLRSLYVDFSKMSLVKNVSTQYAINLFGVVVCCIDRVDYTSTLDPVENQFKGWRVVYITTADSMLEKKDELIWDLMKSGYMSYIRMNYKNPFKQLIVGQDFGKKIIKQRLKIWGDKPKYRWVAANNKSILSEGSLYVLSVDPSFYDYMPEEN